MSCSLPHYYRTFRLPLTDEHSHADKAWVGLGTLAWEFGAEAVACTRKERRPFLFRINQRMRPSWTVALAILMRNWLNEKQKSRLNVSFLLAVHRRDYRWGTWTVEGLDVKAVLQCFAILTVYSIRHAYLLRYWGALIYPGPSSTT